MSKAPERWRRVVETDLDYAATQLTKPDSQLLRTFVVHAKDELHVIGAPKVDAESEEIIHRVLLLYCVAHDAEAISVISEAWARSVPRAAKETEAEWQERAEAVMPADAEDRIELVLGVVIWRTADRRRRWLQGYRPIERAADGTPSLGATVWADDSDNDRFDAKIMGCLPTHTAPPELRELAAVALKRRLEQFSVEVARRQ